MRFSRIAFTLLISALVVSVVADDRFVDSELDDVDDEDLHEMGVLMLTDQNFVSEVQDSTCMVAYFFAPWCEHCKDMDKTYGRLQKLLKEQNSPCVLGKVDSTMNPIVKQHYDLKGYPTLLMFRDGEVDEYEDYKGPSDEHNMAKFLSRFIGKASELVNLESELANFVAHNQVVVVGVFEDSSDLAYTSFAYMAREKATDLKYGFAHTFTPDILSTVLGESAPQPPYVVMRKFYDPEIEYYTEKFEYDKMMEWIEIATIKSVLVLGGDREKGQDPAYFTEMAFQDESIPKLLVAIDSSTGQANQDMEVWKEILTTVRRMPEHRYKYSYMILDAGNIEREKIATMQFVDPPSFPQILASFKDDVLYKIDGADGTAEQAADFLTKVANGSWPRAKKSQAVPVRQGVIREVVGDSFMEEVHENDSRDVLITFYDGPCPGCTEMKQSYVKLAQSLQEESDKIWISKFDVTLNELPIEGKYLVDVYPTMFLKTSKGDIIKYTGNMAMYTDILGFIREHGTASLDEQQEFEL